MHRVKFPPFVTVRYANAIIKRCHEFGRPIGTSRFAGQQVQLRHLDGVDPAYTDAIELAVREGVSSRVDKLAGLGLTHIQM